MILKSLSFLTLVLGSDLKYYPSLGIVFEKQIDSSALFLSKIEKSFINVNYNLPEQVFDFENVVSSSRCPGMKQNEFGDFAASARQFFINRLHSEIFDMPISLKHFGEISKTRNVKSETLSQRQIRAANLTLVGDSGTITQAPLKENLTDATMTTPQIYPIKDQIKNKKYLINDIEVSNVHIKFPNSNFDDFLSSNFTFSCEPVSSNSRVYRDFSFETATVLAEVKMKTNIDIVQYSLDHPSMVILRVTSDGHGNTTFSEFCENKSLRNSSFLNFQCPDLRTNTHHSYFFHIGFLSKTDCEEAYFSDLSLKIPSKRMRRQVGEFLLAGVGALFGYEATKVFENKDRNDNQNELIQLATGINSLSSSVETIQHELSLNMQKSLRQICIIENIENDEKLDFMLEKIFEDFLNGLEMIIIKSTLQVKGSVVLDQLKVICKNLNGAFPAVDARCEEFLRIPGKIRLDRVMVPDTEVKGSKIVGVILKYDVQFPVFLEVEGSVFSTFQVPVPTGRKSNLYSYKFYENVPEKFTILKERIGSATMFPLNNCEKQNMNFFCKKSTLNQIFTKTTKCLNSIAFGGTKCLIDTFDTKNDCFFAEISQKLLLISNQGFAKLSVNHNDALNYMYGYGGKYQKIQPVDILHNITAASSVNCKFSRISFTQTINNYNLNINFSEQNNSFVEEKIKKLDSKVIGEIQSTISIKIENSTMITLSTTQWTFSRSFHNWIENIGFTKYIIYLIMAIIFAVVGIFLIMTIFKGVQNLLIWGINKMWNTVSTGFQRPRVSITESLPLRRNPDRAATPV